MALQNTTLRSYQHASRIFTDGNFRLSPKYGFLFYVEFDFNPLITSVSNNAAQELGMIVKTVSLPKFTVDHKIQNAYNRVNISQHKIKYDPVQITFHDDQADVVRNFWYDYYSFYYRDSDYADATYQGISKYQRRPTFDWGYSLRPTLGKYVSSGQYQPYQYIQGIRIYSLYQKNFSEYQLVNPTIISFSHGEHNQADNNGLVQHSMSIQFETVKYLTGYTTGSTAGGYIDLHYDNTPSPNSNGQNVNQIADDMGGTVQTSTDVIDLAYTNPLTDPLRGFSNGISMGINAVGGQGGALSFGQAFQSATNQSGANGAGGGFNIPTLGSLTQGATNASLVAAQLQTAASTIAGTVTANFANGVVGGIAKGLGPQGGAIVGGIASAIINPKAALAAVENIAVTYVTQKVAQWAINTTTPYINDLSNAIAKGVNNYITQPITSAFGDVSSYASAQYQAFVGGGTVVNSVGASGASYVAVGPGDILGSQDYALGLAAGGATSEQISTSLQTLGFDPAIADLYGYQAVNIGSFVNL